MEFFADPVIRVIGGVIVAMFLSSIVTNLFTKQYDWQNRSKRKRVSSWGQW